MNLFLLFQSAAILLFPPISFYDISFSDGDGKKVMMSDFKEKKVLIASFDAPNVSTDDFNYLDSLQNIMPDIQIIVVPVVNVFRNRGENEIQSIKRNIKSRIIFSSPSDVKRDFEKNQHSLFQWLTKSSNNNHFDVDGKPGQYFVVSGKGTLYAVLEPGVSKQIISLVLSTPFDESKEYILNPDTNFYEPKK